MTVPPFLRLLPWLVFGQGLFLALACLTRGRYRSNRFLGLFLILLSLHALVGLAWQGRGAVRFPELIVLFSCLPFLYGPLVYRYVWHSLLRDWPDPVPFAVHALPALLNLLIYGGLYVLGGRARFVGLTAGVFAGRAPAYVIAIEWGKVVHGLFYTFLIIRLLRRHREGLRRWAAREQRRRWLRALVLAFALNWLLVLAGAILLWGRGFPEELSLAVTAVQLLAFLAFLYMITFFALRYPSVLEPKEVREEIRRKLNLPPEFVEETLRRLEKARTEGVHTDPEITLTSLADRLGLHPNALSFIVNEETGQGFREYLNGLRLETFLDLARGEGTGRPHLDLAFRSGFASKTTFLRAFRARYGTTPGEYLADGGPGSHTPGTGTHTGAT